jgi:hypothetical protein
MYCVAGENCDPASHGGYSVRYTCTKCGATRLVNINQTYIEKSPWERPCQEGDNDNSLGRRS